VQARSRQGARAECGRKARVERQGAAATVRCRQNVGSSVGDLHCQPYPPAPLPTYCTPGGCGR